MLPFLDGRTRQPIIQKCMSLPRKICDQDELRTLKYPLYKIMKKILSKLKSKTYTGNNIVLAMSFRKF